MMGAALRIDRAGPQAALQRHSYQQPVCDLSKHLHVVSVPSSQPENGGDEAQMRPETVPQSSIGQHDRIPSREAVKEAIKAAFAEVLPQYRVTAQEIADKIGARDATVEGWRTKPGLMSAEYLVILMIAFPQFGAAVRQRLRIRPELAPTVRSVLDELEQKLAGVIL